MERGFGTPLSILVPVRNKTLVPTVDFFRLLALYESLAKLAIVER